MPRPPGNTTPAADVLSQADRVLERRLRDVGVALSSNPESIERETLIWLLGAVLQQRDRFADCMRGAAAELRDIGSDKAELMKLLDAYGTIRSPK